MELTIVGKYRALVIKPDEELDESNAAQIRQEADKLIRKTGIKNVLFDMRRVSFMDSSGIGVIMGRYRTVCTLGGAVAVFGMSHNIRRIIEMSGVRDLVLITDKLHQALEEVAKVC